MRLVIPIALALGGCLLYTAPIIERPSIDIVPESSDPVYRGDTVTYDAVGTDPQHKPIAFNWTVYACIDGTNQDTCDPSGQVPGVTTSGASAKILVPYVFMDGSGTPVQALRILVSARDTAGATTSGDQLLVVPVSDHPPALSLREDSAHGFVVNAPFAIYAKVGPFIDATWYADWDYSERLVKAGYPIIATDGFAFTHLHGPRSWLTQAEDERQRREYEASHIRQGLPA